MTEWQQAVMNLLNIKPGSTCIPKREPTTRVCRDCGKEKDVFFFYAKNNRCKPCQHIYVAKWKKENKTWG